MFFIYSRLGAVSFLEAVSFHWITFPNKEIEINPWLAASYVLANEIKS